MSQPTTSGTTGTNTVQDGDRSDTRSLRIDDGAFELLSATTVTNSDEPSLDILDWFETWSGVER